MRHGTLACAAVAALVLATCVAGTNIVYDGPLPTLPAGAPRAIEGFPGSMFGVPYTELPLPENAFRGLYEHTTCLTDQLIRPASTAELSAAIKEVAAKAAAAGRPLKMRTAHTKFATMQSFPCPIQPADPKTGVRPTTKRADAPYVAGIMMDKMTKVLSHDKATNLLRVQAQINIRELLEYGNANGISPPRSSLPWWQGLTLGGIFATASHGSGLHVTSMICDWVKDFTWIDATGKVHVSAKGSPEFNAQCGGIGLLGSITEFNLEMTPTSNTLLSTWYLKPDTNLAEDIEKMLNITPHLVLMWRPDIGRYTGHMQRPAPEGAAVIKSATSNVIPQFTELQAGMLGPSLRNWQNDPFNRDWFYWVGAFDTISCTSALTNAVGASWATKPGPLSALGMNIPILEGVAPTNNIISTECGDRCAFTSKKMQANALDVEFAFEKKRLPQVIADIKAIIAQDLRGLPGWGSATRCLLPGYFVFRFGHTSKKQSDIGMAANLDEPVYVQQQMLASKNTPGVPSKYEWVQDTYEQIMLCKHDGRPHPGKNWDRTFTNPRCPVVPKYGPGLARMTAMQDKYDPQRVFEPELFTRAIAGEKYALKPKCQLDRTCYCEADENCADGFKCVPSIAFPEYKACRPIVMNK
ncbi:MAG: hypothetical protein J3K34DRAFT_415296 [Monoraphidium minutum]|nr:MAG: hypothetical protein J3K34DRAFT_415296 [Monoraphidium minutum]